MIILSAIDFMTFFKKNEGIPAVISTLFLITVFILVWNTYGLMAGVLAGLIAMMLVDLNLFQGVPDVKCFIACGITLESFIMVSLFGAFTIGVGIAYQFLVRKMGFKQIPFLPAILIAYIGVVGVMLL